MGRCDKIDQFKVTHTHTLIIYLLFVLLSFLVHGHENKIILGSIQRVTLLITKFTLFDSVSSYLKPNLRVKQKRQKLSQASRWTLKGRMAVFFDFCVSHNIFLSKQHNL